MTKNSGTPFLRKRKLQGSLIGFPLALVIFMLVPGTIISMFAPTAQAASLTDVRKTFWLEHFI